jgi:hypothetical protein
MSLIITFLVTSFLCLVDMLVTWNIYKRFWGCRPNKTSLLPPLGLLIEETYPEIMVCACLQTFDVLFCKGILTASQVGCPTQSRVAGELKSGSHSGISSTLNLCL